MTGIEIVRRLAFALLGVCAGITLVILGGQVAAYDADVQAYVHALSGSSEAAPLLFGWPWLLVIVGGVGLAVGSLLYVPFDEIWGDRED